MFLFAVPAPVSLMLASNVPNPIPPFGSDVTLTCTASLSIESGIDIPLNVNFELLRTDPASGSPLTTTPPSVSGSTYTTTAMISSVSRSDSGVYTCRASINSTNANAFISGSNTESHSVRVTTGEICTIILS